MLDGIRSFTYVPSDQLKKTSANCTQILLAIMSGAFGLAGWYFGMSSFHPPQGCLILIVKLLLVRNPTTNSSEANIVKAHESEPWKTGRASVYQYHPGGDTSAPPKDAPSALNVVIVPNVNLPRVRYILSASYCLER